VQYLPGVYREEPRAADFTERFFALFDASLEDIDRAIVRYPALLDADGVPEQLLPWLGRFLDIAFDPAWDTARRRRILKAAPALYRRRGTLAGLAQAVQLVFDQPPVIRELAHERNWGALGGARLRAVRLFGRSRARLRLGTSSLSAAPIRSYGNPDDDPLSAQAYRFQVLMPPQPGQGSGDPTRLVRLIDHQKPAHTLASVRVGGNGLVLGVWSAVGIDTLIGAPPAPRLAEESARLNRTALLRHGRLGARTALRVGQSAAIGINTRME
jgi:phage tail-like protein